MTGSSPATGSAEFQWRSQAACAVGGTGVKARLSRSKPRERWSVVARGFLARVGNCSARIATRCAPIRRPWFPYRGRWLRPGQSPW
jgi:hypothetical protein